MVWLLYCVQANEVFGLAKNCQVVCEIMNTSRGHALEVNNGKRTLSYPSTQSQQEPYRGFSFGRHVGAL